LANDVVDVVFTGLDRGVEGGVEQDYQRSLSRSDALDDSVLLAYELNGRPLPPQHGFPLRVVVPGWYGMTNVKWLARITAITERFTGYQQERGYRLRSSDDESGTPLSRMAPRALMVPPGIPDFMTRQRLVPAGDCRLDGRAWSGCGDVVRVEVSVDAGTTWFDAALGPRAGPHAWRPWSFVWRPQASGDHVLCCRATDSAGGQQPLEPGWNLGGYANNAVQRVAVTVR
jgi:DMSO/TMAO reductase YedYZ molybdopterin-dependent catalytic subunit